MWRAVRAKYFQLLGRCGVIILSFSFINLLVALFVIILQLVSVEWQERLVIAQRSKSISSLFVTIQITLFTIAANLVTRRCGPHVNGCWYAVADVDTPNNFPLP